MHALMYMLKPMHAMIVVMYIYAGSNVYVEIYACDNRCNVYIYIYYIYQYIYICMNLCMLSCILQIYMRALIYMSKPLHAIIAVLYIRTL
jgi:hypothetical protein